MFLANHAYDKFCFFSLCSSMKITFGQHFPCKFLLPNCATAEIYMRKHPDIKVFFQVYQYLPPLTKDQCLLRYVGDIWNCLYPLCIYWRHWRLFLGVARAGEEHSLPCRVCVPESAHPLFWLAAALRGAFTLLAEMSFSKWYPGLLARIHYKIFSDEWTCAKLTFFPGPWLFVGTHFVARGSGSFFPSLALIVNLLFPFSHCCCQICFIFFITLVMDWAPQGMCCLTRVPSISQPGMWCCPPPGEWSAVPLSSHLHVFRKP